jgi:hypothetical protein
MLSELYHTFKANIFAKDLEGKTLLHQAAMSGAGRDLIPYIYNELGLAGDSVDYIGRTALHYVAYSDQVDEEFKVHEYLVRVAKCPVDHQDNVK